MKILGLLWKNLRRGVATLRFPEAPPMTAGFRGLVRFDPTRCTGCAMCRFRCTTRAITFNAAGKQFTWAYDPSQCTFCGRCVDGCKDHALTQDADCPPIYLSARALRKSYTLQRKTPPPKSQPVPAATSAQQESPMNSIEELAAELKVTDISTDISGVKWFSTGNLNLRELVQVLSRAGARFVTITATELPMNQGFCLEYLWDFNGQLLGFAFYPAGNTMPSIYDICEAADWIEREIHEEFSIIFTGRVYEPLLLRDNDHTGVNLHEVTK